MAFSHRQACAFFVAIAWVSMAGAEPSETPSDSDASNPSVEAPAPREAEAPAEQTAASVRTLKGKVVDEDTALGVAWATILVRGTGQRVATDEDGNFEIEDVSAEEVTLSVRRDTYHTSTVPVPPHQTEVAVELASVNVEEIVVTGRATRISEKNLANSVSRVYAEEIQDVAAPTISEALQGRVAGANILANSGAPGGGIQMQLRGVSTINGRSEPLYVIDGVIVSDVAIPSGLSAVSASTGGSNATATQDNQVNRIADINTNDIESIEILKGASAAAIYGAKASNGVVVITTKRGKAGAPKVNVIQRLGMFTPANKLGSRAFETLAEAEEFNPNAAAYYEPGKTYDHEAELTSQRELSTETAVSVSGGGATTDYYASLLAKNDRGIIPGTGYQKQSGRLTIGQRFSDRLTLRGTANIVHSSTSRGLTNNDNADISPHMVFSPTPNFFDLNKKDGEYPVNPYVSSGTNPLQTAALMSDVEDVWRLLGSINGTLELWSNEDQRLELAANAGVDRFQQKNNLYFPRELHFEPNDGLPGTALDTNSNNLNLNIDANLIHIYGDGYGPYTATTAAGVQFEQRTLDAVYIVSRNLVAGQSNVDLGTQIEITELRERIRDRGFYLQEELLLFDETLTVTGAIRAEQSSVIGNPDALFFYPKLATAYRLPTFFSAIDGIKARAAYGETGNLPLYGQKFTALNATQNIHGNLGVVSNGTIGNADIIPERQREIEAGIDVTAFNDRLSTEVTVYQRNISDLLLDRTPAASTGASTEFFNGGKLRNRGIEIALAATPLKAGRFAWLSRATFAMNRSKITDLPIPAFNAAGFRTSLGAFRIEQGKSATQIVGNVLRADGTCCEVAKVGDSEPDFRAGFYNSFTYGQWRLGMLLDWQQGGDIINLTRLLYDASSNSVDYEVDPAEKRGGQYRISNFGENTGLYVEDATFLKVRELVVSYDVPKDWLASLGFAESAQFSLSGRNLLTFTNYSGLDPEVSNFGNQPVGRNIDVAPYPPARSFWFSVAVGI